MGKFIDLTGQTFGRWTVESKAEEKKNKQICWVCICICGNRSVIRGQTLRNGDSTSCGCRMTEFKDLTGGVYSLLTVESQAARRGKYYMYNCVCVCGNKIVTRGTALTSGAVNSCGCFRNYREGVLIYDLTGKTYGRLTVDSVIKERRNGQVYWNCICICGKTLAVDGCRLRLGMKTCCGCTKREEQDVTGQVFGRLTVKWTKRINGINMCGCICECGETLDVTRVNLIRTLRPTKSCGCLQIDMTTTHGMSRDLVYIIWQGMKKRCNNPDSEHYKYYGGRGIKVCKEWEDSFVAFYEHIGPRPSDKHSLDRIDNNGNYEPGNVRWATAHEQSTNKRSNNDVIGVYPTVSGKHQWLTRTGGKYYSGTCETREEAAKAYDDKCEELYGDRPNKT